MNILVELAFDTFDKPFWYAIFYICLIYSQNKSHTYHILQYEKKLCKYTFLVMMFFQFWLKLLHLLLPCSLSYSSPAAIIETDSNRPSGASMPFSDSGWSSERNCFMSFSSIYQYCSSSVFDWALSIRSLILSLFTEIFSILVFIIAYHYNAKNTSRERSVIVIWSMKISRRHMNTLHFYYSES